MYEHHFQQYFIVVVSWLGENHRSILTQVAVKLHRKVVSSTPRHSDIHDDGGDYNY